VLALLSPGQGAQKPGFLQPWLEAVPTAEARLRWWSVLAGVDLVHLGTDAGKEEIKDTARTQPLLVATALLAAEQLADARLAGGDATLPPEVAVVGGHSVGELSAAALSGALTAETAVALAGVRGREMAAACALEPTGMAAVLGGEEAAVLAAIDEHGLYPANRNGAGQIVAAGAAEALAKFSAEPPSGARVRPLPVAGAFHTPYMAPAEQALAAIADGITPTNPTRILLSNLDGSSVDDGKELVRRLVTQVTAPVRWDACLRTLADLGVTAVIELPPAGTLTNLIKREFKGGPCPELLTLNTPDDLPAARELLARHATVPADAPAVQFRLAVAGAAGTFAPTAGLAEGDEIHAGQLLGQVMTRQGPVDVTAHGTGVLVEWLAHQDDPVAPGQPLARIGGHQ
jgi:[acyl-carrier-protein] S-malonyltransferase